MKKNNNKGYTVILSILMVGFMLLLSLGVFGLVLKEAKDTKNIENYLKSYNGAEGGLELALYELKINDYYLDKTITSAQKTSKIYGDITNFNNNLYPELNYSVNTKTNIIQNKSIESGKFNIIPLKNVKEFTFNSSSPDKTIWNILSGDSGITGVGNIDSSTKGYFKTIDSFGNITFQEENIYDYLNSNLDNYLYINNQSSGNITYTLESLTPGEKFITDIAILNSSSEVGGLKQNLKMEVNNNEHLNLLKYSIYSPY